MILNPRRIKARGSRPAVEDDGATCAATHLTVPDGKEDHEVLRGGQLGKRYGSRRGRGPSVSRRRRRVVCVGVLVEADWYGGVGLRGGKGSAPDAHRPFRLTSKTDGSRSIPAE